MIGEELLRAAMRGAVAAAIDHVRGGGLPFVGLLVGEDGYVSPYGVNRVRETGDPSAHAEIVAMRIAMAEGRSLEGLRLLATGEPCSLCYDFAHRRGIAGVRFAVSADEAAEREFDYRAPSWPGNALSRAARPLPVDRRFEPFRLALAARDLSAPPSTPLRKDLP